MYVRLLFLLLIALLPRGVALLHGRAALVAVVLADLIALLTEPLDLLAIVVVDLLLGFFERRRSLRVIQRTTDAGNTIDYDLRPVTGGLLVQIPDTGQEDPSTWKIVTKRLPTEREMRDLEFAWKAAKHVKSNAIVLAKNRSLIGMGAGQPNRVTSVFLALRAAAGASTSPLSRAAATWINAWSSRPDGDSRPAATQSASKTSWLSQK